MMSQQPPEWTKRVIVWLSRQPKWVLAVGSLAILVVIMLASSSLVRSTVGPEGSAAGTTNDPTALSFDIFFRLILVVIAIFIAAMMFKRWQSGSLKRGDRQLVMLETLQINPRRALHLVRAGEQVFLIGSTDQAVSLIGQVPSLMDAEIPAETPGKDGLSFSQHLSMAGHDLTNPQKMEEH